MSVDPFIQSPSNSQSFNPYSYIMNNPMAGVDPTGYVAKGTNASNWRTSGCDLDPMGCTSTPVERVLEQYVGNGEANRNSRFAENLEKFNDRMNTEIDAISQAWGAYAELVGTVTKTDLASADATTGTSGTGTKLTDLASGLGRELLKAGKRGGILYSLTPTQIGDSTVTGAISKGEMDDYSQTLYHYTNSAANVASIMATQTLRASFGEKNARYGSGQYFTDISPLEIAAETVSGLSRDDITLGYMSKGQAALRLFGDSRKRASLNYYIMIDVKGLPIQNPRPNVYYLPNTQPLDLRGRVKGYGLTIGPRDSNE